MTRYDAAALVVMFVIGARAVACTPRQRAKVADMIGDIAAEVCVEGDSVSVCLKKCEAATEGR